MDYIDLEKIIDLLAKRKLSLLTDSERSELDMWISRSRDNAELADRFNDDFLMREQYCEYVSADTKKTCYDMERRLAHQRRKKSTTRWVAWISSVAAVILMALFVINRYDPYSRIALLPSLVPMLYVDDGREISLENASIKITEEKLAIIRYDETGISEEIVVDGRGSLIYSTLIVPNGSTFDLELSDGSHVWLNAGSQLKYPVSFGSGAREVELSGEAFFKVADDESHPFRVCSGIQTVEVLGTQFNVNAYSDNNIYTTLIEGAVTVSTGSAVGILQPGMQSVVSGGNMHVRHVRAEHLALWRNGMIVLEGRNLEDIMSDLARWYDFEVIYSDNQLKEISFKGAIPRGSNLSQILDVLRMTDEVDFRIKGNTVIVGRLQKY